MASRDLDLILVTTNQGSPLWTRCDTWLVSEVTHHSALEPAKINRPLPNAWRLNAPLQFTTTLLIRSLKQISLCHLDLCAAFFHKIENIGFWLMRLIQESIYSPPSAMWICHCQILGNELQMQSLFPLFASRFRVMQAEFIKPFTWSQHPLLICTFPQSSSIFTVISYYLLELTCPPALWIAQIPSCWSLILY